MSTAAKKQKNRECYLKNREEILNRARERSNLKRCDHLEIVPQLRVENFQPDSSDGSISDLGQTSEKIQTLSESQLMGRLLPRCVQENAMDIAQALYDVVYQVPARSINNSFQRQGHPEGTNPEPP